MFIRTESIQTSNARPNLENPQPKTVLPVSIQSVSCVRPVQVIIRKKTKLLVIARWSSTVTSAIVVIEPLELLTLEHDALVANVHKHLILLDGLVLFA